MKFIPSLMVAVALVAADARGQADMIIKQRAREISNQNNVRQGVAPASQPAARPAAASTSAALTPVQQSLARVRADLAAIKENTPVTAAQKEQLATDLMATAQGAKKPTQAAVATLAADLATAFVQKPLSETDRNRLLTDLAAALNPANIQPAQIQAVVADVQALFQVNGLSRKEAVKIADGVKAIAAETRA
jgi:hypothetical protein